MEKRGLEYLEKGMSEYLGDEVLEYLREGVLKYQRGGARVPASKKQPEPIRSPVLSGVQFPAEQLEEKNGAIEIALTTPEYPLLHEHPIGTETPTEFIGQGTGLQEPDTKGEIVNALIVPLNPFKQVQPEPTLVPILLDGQAVAVHVDPT